MKQIEIDRLSIKERITSPTPKFFRTLKVIGLTLAAASGALLVAPVVLPAIVTTIAGYIAVASSVVSAVSQVTLEG